MKREEIIAITNRFLIEEFEVDGTQIHVDGDLKTTLDLDSLDYVDLVVIIESNFGIKLESKDFVSIVTFGDLYQLIDNKLKTIA